MSKGLIWTLEKNLFAKGSFRNTLLKAHTTMHLSPKRIEEYLGIIFHHGGLQMCQAVMNYILLVLGKNLQMMVAYNIFNKDAERVTQHFQQFNLHYANLMKVFTNVTKEEFIPGKEFEAIKDEEENASVSELSNFLSKIGLTDLEDLFTEESIGLEDVLKMDNTEMKDIGITNYSQRKTLIKAIKDVSNQGKFVAIILIYRKLNVHLQDRLQVVLQTKMSLVQKYPRSKVPQKKLLFKVRFENIKSIYPFQVE